MLDRTAFDAAIEELVTGLTDSSLCIDYRPERFDAQVLEVAQVHSIGVTNVMGHVYQQVALSSRFNPTRKQHILDALQLRGVGVPKPALRRF